MYRSLSRRAGGWAFALAGALGMGEVHAYAYDNCILADSNDTYVAHVVGTFRPAAQQYDFLTDWINLDHPEAWSCTRYTNEPDRKIEVQVKPWMPVSGIVQADYTLPEDGRIYSIYYDFATTNHHNKVVYIMRRRYTIKSASGYEWTGEWHATRHNNHNDVHQYDHFMALPHLDTYEISIESQVRLLKWLPSHAPNTNFPRTGEAIEFQVTNWRYWVTQHWGGWHAGLGLPMPQDYVHRPQRYSRVRVWFNREDKTCTTPSSEKLVLLPPVPRSAFDASNTAGTTPFTLELINCSAGITSIEYKLVPVRLAENSHNPTALETINWAATYSNGTLSNTGTATGVGVQVLDANGQHVDFDRTSRVVAFDSNPGPAASIPLQAQYIKTDANVTAGSVIAVMSVLYMYK